ncbi:MAG: hypothetical protein AAF389_01565 [Gemmatimonadota bacterium]
MTEREDRKVVEVPIARYGYRHEAEFAAGFLDDAGIWYRMQLDDPTLGTAAAASATIWVLGADVEHARDLLELDGSGRSLVTPSKPDIRAAHQRQLRAAGSGARVGWPRLEGRERLLSLVGAGGCFAVAPLVESVAFGTGSAVVAGAVLGAAALFGSAPRWLRNLLSALTGGEP